MSTRSGCSTTSGTEATHFIVLRLLAVISHALACLVVSCLVAFTLWVVIDSDAAFGTAFGIGELDCNRGGEDCGRWSELFADYWWLIVFGVGAALGLAMLPWFRARLTRWDQSQRLDR